MAKEREEQNRELQKISVSLHDALKKEYGTLEDAEQAFKISAAFNEYSLLLNAIAAWQISDKKLWSAKFRSLEQYLRHSGDRLGISRAYFFERVKMAEAYLQYRDQLYSAGFKEERDASNLRLFFKAQEKYGTEKAIKKLPKMSYRQYQHWVMGKSEERSVDIEINDDGIHINGELIISARAVAKIYETGQEPYVIGVMNNGEKRAVIRYINARREGKAAE